MDGKIIIETEVNNKGIDKGIAEIEKKMDALRQKAEQPYEVDGISVMNMQGKTTFLGSLRVFDERNASDIMKEVKSKFNTICKNPLL